MTEPNDNDLPRKLRWNHIELYGHEGTRFGVLMDSNGLLAITIAPPGRNFPDGFPALPENVYVQFAGQRCFRIQGNDRIDPDDDPEKLRDRIANLEQLVCDFQASALINVKGESGPCRVDPQDVEQEVTRLRNELARLVDGDLSE
jgi:hypothetical protein